MHPFPTTTPPAGPVSPGPARPRTSEASPAMADWQLETVPHGVRAVSQGSTVAEVEVLDGTPEALLRFWISTPDVPVALRSALVREVFGLSLLRPDRRVLAAVPHGDAELLDALRGFVDVADTHVAGATCLLDGRVSSPGASAPTGGSTR